MPPVARGRGRGRGGRGRGDSTPANRKGVKLLVKTAESTEGGPEDDEQERIEAEVAQLLQQTGLHNKEGKEQSTLETSIKGAEDEKQLDELARKIIPPKDRYPPPEENLVEQISRDVEWAAEVTAITSKHNASRPQKVIDHLTVSSIEQWSSMDSIWGKLWTKRSQDESFDESALLDRVFGAFEDDLYDLAGGVNRALESVDREVAHLKTSVWTDISLAAAAAVVKGEEDSGHESKRRRVDDGSEVNPQWMINYLQMNSTARNEKTGEPFWNVMDPDNEIYTDSEEEDNQTVLRHAPFIRPLRHLVRDLRRREKLATICGRSLRVFDETNDVSEVIKSNVETVEKAFYDEEDKQKRQKREMWREWVDAARYAQWKISSAPSIPIQRFEDNCYESACPELLDSLDYLQVISHSNSVPTSRVGRAFLRHFATHLPHRLDRAALQHYEKDTVWLQMHNAFDWTIPDLDEIIHPERENIINSDDTELLKVKMCPPGLRFYVGRATTIWGSPVAPGYQRTHSAMEFFFWMKRMEGAFEPLFSLHRHKARKQRPRVVPAKYEAALAAVATEAGDGSALSAALALQTAGGEGGALDAALGGGWGMQIKVTTERDSSDSEPDLKERVQEDKENAAVDNNPSRDLFHWSGYGHDADVVRLGRFGRLRNVWDKPRRRRLGFECVPNPKTGRPSGRPIAPDYSSSEESYTGLVDDQTKYRAKPRTTRKLIQKQRERVLEFRRALRASEGSTRKRDREAEVLSSLYGHHLGPLALNFEMPRLRTDWPGSQLDTYEEHLQRATTETKGSRAGLEGRLEMALSAAQKLGLKEECWTHLTDKKGRVRGIEPRMEHEVGSKIPLGFLGSGTDLAGAQYQLVGIDNNEFWRRMGDNKAMNQNLAGFEDLLKGR